MRLLGPSFAVICAAYLNAMCGFAQGVDQHQAEEKLDPYNKHHDLHHGHQHTYPDRGAIFRDVPRGEPERAAPAFPAQATGQRCYSLPRMSMRWPNDCGIPKSWC